MLRIVHTPNPILATSVKKITKFDKSLHKLVEQMTKTLEAQFDPPGVGLAANQVGLDLSLFIMKPTTSAQITVCINPEIIEHSELSDPDPDEMDKLEGCLSIPRMWAPVRRYKSVRLRYQTIEGKTVEKTFAGFKAVIVQHEVDHLQGVLFVQRALEQGNNLYKEVKGELKRTNL